MQCRDPGVAKKPGGQKPLQSNKPSASQSSTTYVINSPAMIVTWISFAVFGLLTWYIWTDACFYGIPKSIARYLPGPLPMSAIFCLHALPVALIANRDGKKLRAARQGDKPSTKQQSSTAVVASSPAMTVTWISNIVCGILTFYIWTDACFYGIPEIIAGYLPGPLPMLAIFWSHVIPIVLIASRDGERLSAIRLGDRPSTKRSLTSVITASSAMTLTCISFIGSAILATYVWTDGWFHGIPGSVCVYSPSPVVMLATIWLHVIVVALIDRRDGERPRAVRKI